VKTACHCDDVFEFKDKMGVNVDDDIMNERYVPLVKIGGGR
jgi:hypothetical protein